MRPLRNASLFVATVGILAIAIAAPSPVLATEYTGIPFLRSITTLPATPCQGVPTRLVAEGALNAGCGRLLGDDPSRFLIALTANVACDSVCPMVMRPWADTLDIGMLAAGSYHTVVTIAEVNVCVAFPETTFYSAAFDFKVQPRCADDPLRFLSEVRVVSAVDPSRPPCAGDSILVLFSGHFPDNCHQLRGIVALPSDIVGPGPEPPKLRLLFDDMCCVEQVCFMTPTPWSGAVILPPLPERGYHLVVEGVEVCCRDSVLPEDPRGTRLIPFAVSSGDSCSRVFACLLPEFDHSARVGNCDTGFDSDGRAHLTLDIASTVALAGLQGRVSVFAEGGGVPLSVTAVEPIGPASGMHLTWSPMPGGAKFVLFADTGAPVPAVAPGIPPPPVVRFTLERAPAAGNQSAYDSTRTWYVYANDLLGADAAGDGVPPCPVRDPERIVADAGIVCVSGECDLNRDGHADVRDLVRMVHCLQGTGPCPSDSLGTLDCEGDEDFDLADVMCCARTVLGLPHCTDCTPDSARVEPRVAVTFGAPIRSFTGVDVPIHLEGADRIGAARLEFHIPESAIAAASVTLAGAPADWLALDSWTSGKLELGLIGIGSGGPTFAPLPTGLDLLLHLGLAPGSTPEGQVALAGSEFSGTDGVLLTTDFGAPVVRLGAGVSVSLDPARPNPFQGSTLIRLTLDAPADVDLGIYDLAGRRLASLHSGALAIGVHPFRWDGAGDDGGRVPSGIYFARASVAGRATTVQKLVMVRGD